ncbi:MAG: hypothetical protein GQ552_01665 [Flavobacteriaceae bacterium]|nr:hypothetical protein [Flavobacteriaceae bacterium]
MKYHQTFEYFEQKTINIIGIFFEKYLLKGIEEDRDFNFLSNNCRKEVNDRQKDIFPGSNQELYSYLSLFKNRAHYYKTNWDENIFKNELFLKYKKGSIRKEITYEDLVFKIAVHTGLDKASSILYSKNNFYSLLFDHHEMKKFIFTYDFDKINILEQELLNKYHPNRGGNIIEFNEKTEEESNKTISLSDVTKDESVEIVLLGVTFNIYEFALYQREWRDCNASGTTYREIYDKVMMDHNDPYSYGKKRYDTTLFYRVLKDDFLSKVNYFDVCMAYNKIKRLVLQTNNTLFKKHIIEKLNKVEYKELCK